MSCRNFTFRLLGNYANFFANNAILKFSKNPSKINVYLYDSQYNANYAQVEPIIMLTETNIIF